MRPGRHRRDTRHQLPQERRQAGVSDGLGVYCPEKQCWVLAYDILDPHSFKSLMLHSLRYLATVPGAAHRKESIPEWVPLEGALSRWHWSLIKTPTTPFCILTLPLQPHRSHDKLSLKFSTYWLHTPALTPTMPPTVPKHTHCQSLCKVNTLCCLSFSM